VWRQTRHESWKHLDGCDRVELEAFLYLTGLMALMNMVSHGTQDMYPPFWSGDWGWGPQARAALTAFSQVGALAGGVLCGLYSDRLGRRRTIGLALAGAPARGSPIWALRPPRRCFVLAPSRCSSSCRAAWGVIPAHINELRRRDACGASCRVSPSVWRGGREPDPARAGRCSPRIPATRRRWRYRRRSCSSCARWWRRRARSAAAWRSGAAINVYTGRPRRKSERKVSRPVMLAAACSHAARSVARPPRATTESATTVNVVNDKRARYERLPSVWPTASGWEASTAGTRRY